MKPCRTVLAFDIGASSGRAILGRFDGARLTLEEIHRFWNGAVKLRGHLYWDIPRLFDEMQNGLQKAIAAQPVSTMAIDTWGVDGAFIGARHSLLGLPYGYRDFTVATMNACLDEFGAETLYGITGIQFMPFNTVFQFYRHVRTKDPLLRVAKRFLFIPDYLRFLFTGKLHTEYTIASTSQMLDARTRRWSPAVLAKLGLKERMLGELVEPGTVCGCIEGTRIKAIATAGHDTGAAVLSVPAAPADGAWAWLSSGTWSIIGIETGEPIITDMGRAKNFANEGGAGGTIRYLKNIAGMWLAQECQRLWRAQGQDYSFAELARMAGETPAGGPVIDVNDARFYAPDNMIEEIRAACRAADQPVPEGVGAIYRCILDSLAHKYVEVLNELHMITGQRFTRLHVVGGGAMNTVLNQLAADVCGIPIITGPVEGTAVGNILMQLLACGDIASIAEGRELVRRSFPTATYMPRG